MCNEQYVKIDYTVWRIAYSLLPYCNPLNSTGKGYVKCVYVIDMHTYVQHMYILADLEMSAEYIALMQRLALNM